MKKYLIFGITGILIFWTVPAFSNPTITSVNGNITHNGNITISGNSFGPKSQASPVVWDDMEGRPVNDYSKLTENRGFNTPTGGYSDVWPKLGSGGATAQTQYRSIPFRNTPAPHPFSSVYMAGCHYQSPNNNPPYIGGSEGYRNVGVTADSGVTSGTWYVHFYYRLDPLWNTSQISYNNHKTTVPEQGSSMYSSNPFSYSFYCNQQSPEQGGEGLTVAFSYDEGCSPIIYTENPRFKWVIFEEIWDNPKRNREIFINNKSGGKMGRVMSLGNTVRGWSIGGYYRRASNINDTSTYRGGVNYSNYRYFDDVYIDNTLSRVILANRANYESATIVEPQIPSAWGDGSITCTVNLGKLSEGNAGYLFVFDVNNNHNSVGYPVTIGGTGGAPGVVQSLRIID